MASKKERKSILSQVTTNILIIDNNIQPEIDFEILLTQIQSPERMIRQRALLKLLEHSTNQLANDEASKLYDKFYLTIFKCYSDRFESCRDLAISIITNLIENSLPLNDYYIEHICQTCHRRIGRSEIIEQSEEIRLTLLGQIEKIVNKCKNNIKKQKEDTKQEQITDYLLKSCNNIFDILIKCLTDPYPMIQRKCCKIIKSFALATPNFHFRADNLVAPLISLVKHRQSQNRIAGIDALGDVVLNIHTNGDLITKCIVTISPMIMDDVPFVRRECGRVGCRWLMSLRDRYSFFERILPLILCCLNDDLVDIREEINDLWIKCGEKYYQENENELNKLEVVDDKPINYPIGIIRPTLGCRAIMQRSLRVCSIVLAEMTDWQDDVRLHSIKFLWQIVLHCEKALTAKFFEIYPVLSKHCTHPEIKSITTEAVHVAELLGLLLNYEQWIEHGFTSLQSPNPKLGTVKCFSIIFKNSDKSSKRNDIEKLTKLLINPNICHNLNVEYQECLLDLAGCIIDLYNSNCGNDKNNIDETMNQLSITNDDSKNNNIEKNLYTLIVKVISMSEHNENITKIGNQLLNSLCENKPLNINKLHEKYLGEILKEIQDLDSENTEKSEPIILLNGLIRLCGFHENYYNEMKSAILLVINNAKSTGKIKIFSAISIGMLKWTEQMVNNESSTYEKSLEYLKDFIVNIIEPVLLWKAGRNNESERGIATTTLYSITQGAAKESYELFPILLAAHFISLVDDNNVVTRAYSLRCLLNCGPINIDNLKPLALGVLSRLDDPSYEVREYAVQCISMLKLNSQDEHEIDSWHTIVEHILKTMMLHLDSPEIKFKDSLIESIGVIGRNYPKILKTILDKHSEYTGHLESMDKIRQYAFFNENQ